MRIWDFKEKRQEAVLQGHTDPIRSLAITKSDKYAVSGSFDNSARIWKLVIMQD